MTALVKNGQAVEPGWLPHQLAMIAATADPATAAVLLQAAAELRRLYSTTQTIGEFWREQ